MAGHIGHTYFCTLRFLGIMTLTTFTFIFIFICIYFSVNLKVSSLEFCGCHHSDTVSLLDSLFHIFFWVYSPACPPQKKYPYRWTVHAAY